MHSTLALSMNANASIADYWQLLKPRVMSLVVFTGLVGMAIAPGTLHPVIALTALLCIALSAGGAGAVNMWYDRDIDAVMQRTQNRPIPAGRMAPDDALAFGVVMIALSCFTMALAVNMVAAGLLLAAALFYVFVYTIGLKRRTPQNIVIGGAAGAFPPMIGWAAVTGDVGMVAIALFLITFLWTPPHFWALALYRADDYAKANVPMLPVTHGARHTKMQMVIYTLLLFPAVLWPVYLHGAGALYGIGATFFTLGFLAHAINVWRSDDVNHAPAKAMFLYSLAYLFAVYILIFIDHFIGRFFV